MRLSHRLIKVEDIPLDVFVFLPKENRFFFVDNVDRNEKRTTLVFEPNAIPDEWVEKNFKNGTELIVIDGYNVNSENFFE